ncbi:MAG: acetate--CoA ligase [Bacteroidetes bacterium]|nr:acetate--CoA ligase [Bacteroidota bacterium]
MAKFHIETASEYDLSYKESIENPEKFWDSIADNFAWSERWDKTLEWNFTEPSVKWFLNGKLNITENCIDRHLPKHADKIAIHWEPNDINENGKSLTYQQLSDEVCRMSNVFKQHGVVKGDRICLYMPMIPDLAIAVLACARIGAVHSIVFGGFSAQSLADRINDAQCKLVVTSDFIRRGAKEIPAKAVVDQALINCPGVATVLVAKCSTTEVAMQANRDLWLHDVMPMQSTVCAPEPMDSEDLLFILYTSGSTGKPKGVVHTCGGYMVYAGYSFKNVFQYATNDVYWCTADIGWITGHTYFVYGPLLNAATMVMFEGVPNFPDAGRFWHVIDKYKVTQFYTAPTAIRSLMACGDAWVAPYNLSSLKILGTVGEPINEEAWQWYHQLIGKDRCPIVDTWWQTETGGIMITSLPNINEQKPAHAGFPLPGIQPVLLDNDGKEIIGNNVEGYLCVKFPWPSILRSTYGDHERCRQTYFANYAGYYFTGDGARRDAHGLYRIIGRVDDVINVSGHRIGTAEVENAINESIYIVESAVVGYPHDIKGQGIYAFVILQQANVNPDLILSDVNEVVSNIIGKLAKPDKIQIVSGLPKTRSGKIMRRILRKIAEGDTSNLGDTSTLLDPAVVEQIKKGAI